MKSIKAIEAYNLLLEPNNQQNCYYYHRKDILQDRGIDFIKKYLRDGGKLNLIEKEREIFENAHFTMRCEHMRSLFLLGIYCYDNVKNIQKTIEHLCKSYKELYGP